MINRLVVALALFINYTMAVKYLPILIWHSAGESCCGSEIKSYTSFLKSLLGDENVHIKTVRIGNSSDEDFMKSLVEHPFEQIKQVCEEIKRDPQFEHGFNAIGLSQGALFVRGLLQECSGTQIRNLISLGGPQQGVFGYPQCFRRFGLLCGLIQSTIVQFAYSPNAQGAAAPATYWHDPNLEETYRSNSTFLAVINNEKTLNPDYIRRVSELRNFVLVKYANDTSIIPNESAHFGYESSGQAVKLRDMDIYKYDRLGLRALDERGALTLLESPGTHLQLVQPWFAANVLKFLKDIVVA